MKPSDLILRCYGYKRKDGTWYAVCIDLNLDAEGGSINDVKRSLNHAIRGYFETVSEVEDGDSLVHLIWRPAPLKERALYQVIRLAHSLRRAVAFQEAVPIYPAAHCAA